MPRPSTSPPGSKRTGPANLRGCCESQRAACSGVSHCESIDREMFRTDWQTVPRRRSRTRLVRAFRPRGSDAINASWTLIARDLLEFPLPVHRLLSIDRDRTTLHVYALAGFVMRAARDEGRRSLTGFLRHRSGHNWLNGPSDRLRGPYSGRCQLGRWPGHRYRLTHDRIWLVRFRRGIRENERCSLRLLRLSRLPGSPTPQPSKSLDRRLCDRFDGWHCLWRATGNQQAGKAQATN